MNFSWILNLSGFWVHLLVFHILSYLTVYLTRYYKHGVLVWLIAWFVLPTITEYIPIRGHTFSLVDVGINYLGVLLTLGILFINRK